MIGLSTDVLDRLFPFHIHFDRQGRLLRIGRSLTRLRAGDPPPPTLAELVTVRRPRRFEPATLADDADLLVLIDLTGHDMSLRGEIASLDGGETFCFLGSPWITDHVVMKDAGLEAGDFALHDPTADHLILLGTLQNALDQARLLAEELEDRSRELRDERTLLTRILSQIPHGIYWKDRSGRYVGCNQNYATLVDLATTEEIIGRTDEHMTSTYGHSLAPNAEDDERVMATGVPVHLRPRTLTSPSGQEIQISVSKVVLRGDDGEVSGMIGVIVDMTAQKLMEDQLAQAGRLESIGQLAAGVAHEINTPIQFVGDNLRFLTDGFGDLDTVLRRAEDVAAHTGPDRPEAEITALVEALAAADLPFLEEEIPGALEQSLDGIERVRRIVTSLKEFSHPGADDFAPADLNEVIRSTVIVASNEWKYVAELTTDLDPELPLVPCLMGEVSQVLLNIVVNASHAIADRNAETGGLGTIHIGSALREGMAEIRITDSGGGIPDEIRAKVFDPFFTTKDVGRGTGQGLALAQLVIVGRHGGTLDFDTRRGEGTTFIVSIPLDRPEPA
ncbi:MAG: ATP-binding protein [Actinomycetota bacterium]